MAEPRVHLRARISPGLHRRSLEAAHSQDVSLSRIVESALAAYLGVDQDGEPRRPPWNWEAGAEPDAAQR